MPIISNNSFFALFERILSEINAQVKSLQLPYCFWGKNCDKIRCMLFRVIILHKILKVAFIAAK